SVRLGSSTNTVSAANFPMSTSQGTIITANTLFAGLAELDSLSTDVYQGDAYTFARLDLRTNVGFTKIDQLLLTRSGLSFDTDVSEVALYRDQDANRVFSQNLDLLISSGSFSGGVASLSFATQTVQNSTASYFVRLKVHPGAVADNTIGFKLANPAAIRTAVSYTTIDPGPYPLQTATPPIRATVNTLSVSVLDVAPGSVLQGGTNVPMVRLGLWTDRNLVRVTGLRVDRGGTGDDSDIQTVKIFNGPPAFSVAASTLVSGGSDPFSSGIANVFLFSPLIVTPATTYAYVTVDLAPGAVPGRTIAVTIASTASVTLNSPNAVSTAAFPIAGAAVAIQSYPDVVSLDGVSLAPAAAPSGQQDILMAKLMFRTTLVDVGLNQVKVSKAGTVSDAEVSDVKLWRDTDGNGSLDVFSDVLVTTQAGRFAGGLATLPLAGAQALAQGATYLLQLSLSSAAVVGRTLSLSLQSDSLQVQSPGSADYSNYPFQTVAMTVSKPVITLSAAGQSLAPATTAQGTVNVPLLRLQLWSDRYFAEWNRLIVARAGAGSDADVSNVRVYRDANGDGLLQASGPGADLLVSQGGVNTLSAGVATIALSTQSITSSTATFIVAADVSPIAASGNQLSLQVASPSGIRLTAPDVVDSANFPLASALMTVQPTVTGVFATLQDLAPPSLPQGATNQLLASLVLQTTGYAALLRSVRLTNRGTSQDNDLTGLNLWLDADDNFVFEPSTDTRLTGGTDRFIGGVATLQLVAREVIDTRAKRLFLTADVNLFADATGSLGVRLASASHIEIEAPNYAVDASYPKDLSLVPIAKLQDVLYAQVADAAPTALNQSFEAEMLRVKLWAGRDRAYVGQWKIGRTGNIADSDVAAVSIYRDANPNGFWDPLDLRVSSGTLVGGQALLAFSPRETVTTSTQTYFVTYLAAGAAVIGRMAGMEISNANYFSVPSPDAASLAPGANSSSLAAIADARTPSMPVVTAPSHYWKHFDRLEFVWVSTVGVGALTGVQYAVGTYPRGADVRGFTPVDPAKGSVVATGLTLQSGVTYYISVKSVSGFGMTSPVGVSDSVLIDFMPPPAPVATITPGETSVLLNWSIDWVGPSGLLGFLVEYRTGTSPQWKNAKTGLASPSALSFTPGAFTPSAAAGASGVAASAAPAEAFALAVSTDELVTGTSFAASPPSGTVFIRMRAVSGSGVLSDATTVTKLQIGALPKDGLSEVSNYPNPFDSRKESTRFNYVLSADSDVTIKIFNVFGAKIAEVKAPAGGPGGQRGSNDLPWDGTDASGRRVAKGMYLAVIEAGGARVIHKVGVVH
ncbi:MAG: hypothetical protein HY554_17535, partial [Elusimicrobia bacterium]|nr:hypothetical protein [Elusimicrobiota bacterium]